MQPRLLQTRQKRCSKHSVNYQKVRTQYSFCLYINLYTRPSLVRTSILINVSTVVLNTLTLKSSSTFFFKIETHCLQNILHYRLSLCSLYLTGQSSLLGGTKISDSNFYTRPISHFPKATFTWKLAKASPDRLGDNSSNLYLPKDDELRNLSCKFKLSLRYQKSAVFYYSFGLLLLTSSRISLS